METDDDSNDSFNLSVQFTDYLPDEQIAEAWEFVPESDAVDSDLAKWDEQLEVAEGYIGILEIVQVEKMIDEALDVIIKMSAQILNIDDWI